MHEVVAAIEDINDDGFTNALLQTMEIGNGLESITYLGEPEF